MHEEVGEVLIPAHRIADRVRELGKLLADAYTGRGSLRLRAGGGSRRARPLPWHVPGRGT